MAIYDYQGVHYDIDTTDPDEARAKIQAHLGKPVAPEKTAGDRLKEFGHAATSLVDTGINAATGTQLLIVLNKKLQVLKIIWVVPWELLIVLLTKMKPVAVSWALLVKECKQLHNQLAV